MRNVKAWLRRTTSGEMHHHDRGFGYDPITKSESQTRNPKFRIPGRYIAGSPNQQCPAELRSRCLMRYSPHSTMINDDAVTAYIRALLPDATVRVTDKTGTKDHLMVRVTSSLFQDLSSAGGSDARRPHSRAGNYGHDAGRTSRRAKWLTISRWRFRKRSMSIRS
jgi:hypothetical protein